MPSGSLYTSAESLQVQQTKAIKPPKIKPAAAKPTAAKPTAAKPPVVKPSAVVVKPPATVKPPAVVVIKPPVAVVKPPAAPAAVVVKPPAAPAAVVKPPTQTTTVTTAVAPASAPTSAPAPAPAPAPTPTPTPTPVGGLKKALLVGINYVNTPYALAGCINDVLNAKTQLTTFFPTCTDIQLLTDDTPLKPTKKNIMDAIQRMVSDLKPGDNVYFHYSGHGGTVTDTNGDEVTGLDSCIYPCNNGSIEIITDDDLRAALAAKIPAGCKCFVVLDACHSGTAVDLRYLWETTSREGGLSYTENTNYAKTAGTVLFLSACKDIQTAADTADQSGRPCGALTWALLSTWRTYGPAIKTKYLLWDVRQFLKQRGYGQVPLLSTGNYMDLNGVFDLGSGV